MDNLELTCSRCNQTRFYSLYSSNVHCIYCGHLLDDYLSEQKKTLVEIFSPFDVHGSTLLKYKGCQSHVIIPSGITEIGYAAFKGCESLESLIISKSLKKISYKAFESCINLKTVLLENNNFTSFYSQLSEIESEAFKNCFSLINIPFPHGLLNIGSEAFINCKQLRGVSIPSSVTRIYGRAFENCTSFTNIDILGATIVHDDAFKNCASVTSVRLFGHLSKAIYLSENAFNGCTNLISVTADDYDYPTPTMTKAAFNGCSKLHTVSFHHKEIYLRYFSDNEIISYNKHEKLYYMELHRKFGKCQYCGGKFRFFNQTCRACGKKKDY